MNELPRSHGLCCRGFIQSLIYKDIYENLLTFFTTIRIERFSIRDKCVPNRYDWPQIVAPVESQSSIEFEPSFHGVPWLSSDSRRGRTRMLTKIFSIVPIHSSIKNSQNQLKIGLLIATLTSNGALTLSCSLETTSSFISSTCPHCNSKKTSTPTAKMITPSQQRASQSRISQLTHPLIVTLQYFLTQIIIQILIQAGEAFDVQIQLKGIQHLLGKIPLLSALATSSCKTPGTNPQS